MIEAVRSLQPLLLSIRRMSVSSSSHSVRLDTSLYGQQSIGGGESNGPGGNRWDETGTLWFHVFIAKGVGAREARRLGKALANLFRGTALLEGDLEFGDADLGSGDPGQENGNYYLLSVSISWQRTEAQ